MRRINICLDEETLNLLDRSRNKSQTIRDAVWVYQTTTLKPDIKGLRDAFKIIVGKLNEIDSKVDYLAGKLND